MNIKQIEAESHQMENWKIWSGAVDRLSERLREFEILKSTSMNPHKIDEAKVQRIHENSYLSTPATHQFEFLSFVSTAHLISYTGSVLIKKVINTLTQFHRKTFPKSRYREQIRNFEPKKVFPNFLWVFWL